MAKLKTPKAPPGRVYIATVTEEERIEYILRANFFKQAQMAFQAAGALMDMTNAELKIKYDVQDQFWHIDTDTGVISVDKEAQGG